MKYLLVFPTLVLSAAFFFSSCKKTETITNTRTDTVQVRAVDTTIAMNARNWNLYSFQTLNLVDSGIATYHTTPEGVRLMGQAYRLGSRLQTKTEFAFHNKVLYFKWKGSGAGQFVDFVPQIKYDYLTNDGTPQIQGVDLGFFSFPNTYSGSTLIQQNTWYYTRVVPEAGTHNYQVITATGNYNNAGGNVISSKTVPIYTKSGYLAFRVGDPYGGTAAYGILGECRIASN